MKGLYTIDLFQTLRFNKKGALRKDGNYQLGIFSSAILDLINLNKVKITKHDKNDLFITTIDNELTGNELLDDIYLMIHDCPKEYTIAEWQTRFIETYNIYEKKHLESLINREIIVNELVSKKILRFIIFLSLIICVPFMGLAIFYYSYAMKQKYYHFKNPDFRNQLLEDLYENLDSFEIPDLSMIGLIIVLRTTRIHTQILKDDYPDYVTKKYYQLKDHDFTNPNIKLFAEYLSNYYY
ncbi:MAG: hypothetical protein JXA54_09650 [Candidatus Heimdallarchaeota archaeon]|nr:hypothetical protein [Candidatus Heimdallarchaeota archaeon]